MKDQRSPADDRSLPATETAGDLVPPTGDRGGNALDPLAGGSAATVVSDGASGIAGYGTLGGFAFDVTGGGALALSAAHVLGQEVGKLVIQPFGGAPPLLDAATKNIAGAGTNAPPLNVVAPAPFTSVLALAAVNSWIATLTGDDEDPSRFGQRTTAVAASARTDVEEIRVTAQAPGLPFAGRVLTATTTWSYRRQATTGVLDQTLSEDRSPSNVLDGKRVWTNAKTYPRGQRVTVGVDLFPDLESGGTSVKIAIPGSAVTASANDGNVPANTVDGNLGTRWSASGDGQWIRFDLGSSRRVTHVKVAFFNGPDRTYTFDIQVSMDGSTWTNARSGVQSLRTTGLETFDIPDFDPVRFVRLVGHQNTVNAFNSYTEVEIFGADPVASPRFVVAHLFPLSAPASVVRRVLDPGPTPEPTDTKVSFRGFPAPAKAGDPAVFPVVVADPFRLDSELAGLYVGGTLPPGAPAGAVALQLPSGSTRLLVPPSTKVEVEVFHRGGPVTATAFSGSGEQRASVSMTVGQNVLQVLVLEGIEITEVVLSASGGPGLVLGVTASRPRPTSSVTPLGYTGSYDIPSTATQGKWGVMVFSQTLDETPLPSADPMTLATRLAGVTETVGVIEGPKSSVELLVDAVFDVT
jgi:hypothetical protein